MFVIGGRRGPFVHAELCTVQAPLQGRAADQYGLKAGSYYPNRRMMSGIIHFVTPPQCRSWLATPHTLLSIFVFGVFHTGLAYKKKTYTEIQASQRDIVCGQRLFVIKHLACLSIVLYLWCNIWMLSVCQFNYLDHVGTAHHNSKFWNSCCFSEKSFKFHLVFNQHRKQM